METSLKDEDYKVISEKEINGRQIKNVVKTAQALASDKGELVGVDHIITVLEMMDSFDLTAVAKKSPGRG